MSADRPQEQTIIAYYAQMLHCSSDMLGAAQRGDWDCVIVLEKQCAELVTRLKGLGELTPSDRTLRDQKRELIRKILANDAVIRDLAHPRMRQIEMQLRAPRNARKLAVAYGAMMRTY